MLGYNISHLNAIIMPVKYKVLEKSIWPHHLSNNLVLVSCETDLLPDTISNPHRNKSTTVAMPLFPVPGLSSSNPDGVADDFLPFTGYLWLLCVY